MHCLVISCTVSLSLTLSAVPAAAPPATTPIALLAAAQAPATQPASPIPEMSDEELAAGKLHFQTVCARCHGMSGNGGEGPALTRPTLRHAPTDLALYVLIRRGLPAGGMPGNPALTEDDAWEVAGYVRRSLQSMVTEPPSGDPVHGREVYRDQGCDSCHILAGEGRGIGPELTEIGARRGPEGLRQSLVDPKAAVAEAFVFVSATTDSGRVDGLRLAEDAFSIQIRDAENRIHSFQKSELTSLQKSHDRSIMPSYRRLSGKDLDDLVAYLASRTDRDMASQKETNQNETAEKGR